MQPNWEVFYDRLGSFGSEEKMTRKGSRPVRKKGTRPQVLKLDRETQEKERVINVTWGVDFDLSHLVGPGSVDPNVSANGGLLAPTG